MKSKQRPEQFNRKNKKYWTGLSALEVFEGRRAQEPAFTGQWLQPPKVEGNQLT